MHWFIFFVMSTSNMILLYIIFKYKILKKRKTGIMYQKSGVQKCGEHDRKGNVKVATKLSFNISSGFAEGQF